MKHWRSVSTSLAALLITCTPCAGSAGPKSASLPQETRGTPQGAFLSRDKAVRLADDAALKKGYSLVDFLPPRVFYQFLKKDRTWSIFYEGKVAKPGNHFLVVVDDRTRAAQVLPGE
jgi:hypothetical protein